MSNSQNEIYTIDTEQEIMLKAFVYEEQKIRVARSKLKDSKSQEAREYKEEEGNITKKIKALNSYETKSIKWAFKIVDGSYKKGRNKAFEALGKKEASINLANKGERLSFIPRGYVELEGVCGDLLKLKLSSLFDEGLLGNSKQEDEAEKEAREEYITDKESNNEYETKKESSKESSEEEGAKEESQNKLINKNIIFFAYDERMGINLSTDTKNNAYRVYMDNNLYDKRIIKQDRITSIELKIIKTRFRLEFDGEYLCFFENERILKEWLCKKNDKKVEEKTYNINLHSLSKSLKDKGIILESSSEKELLNLLEKAYTNSQRQDYENDFIELNIKYQKRILILIERFKETTESTLARMNIYIDNQRVKQNGEIENEKGIKPIDDENFPYAYILERNGSDSIGGELKLRIPEGIYDVSWHIGKKRKNNIKLYNDFVSPDRYILIHEGYTKENSQNQEGASPRNTYGCLVIAKERVKDKNNPNLWADNILKADSSKKDDLTKAITQKDGFIYKAILNDDKYHKASEVVKYIGVKIVNKFNLTHCTNIENNVTKINNQKGIHLFSLERKNIKESKLKAKELYEIKGIQWFETSADNYHKLLYVNEKLKDRQECQSLGVLYFTWKEVVEFAEMLYVPSKHNYELVVNFSKYFNGKIGDWKQAENGANKHILVSMEGIPYWADAVGQIPFAINCYKTFYEITKNHNYAKNATINIAYLFHNGSIDNVFDFLTSDYVNVCGLKPKIYDEILEPPTDKNSYDNKMILRAIGYTYLSKYSNRESLALDSTRKAIYE
ncbi:hypothetical protein DMC01_12620 [Campylobacter troglodytis]|nr:hypothetical protein DMC01_12620 [Campylobacter troglodytis]